MRARFLILASCLVVSSWPLCGAAKGPDKATEIPSTLHIYSFKEMGKVKAYVDRYDEPVAEPIAISIDISCGSELAFKRLITDVRACRFIGVDYDQGARGAQGAKTLKLRFKVYNPIGGKCDDEMTKALDIERECS